MEAQARSRSTGKQLYAADLTVTVERRLSRAAAARGNAVKKTKMIGPSTVEER
jgi:hypothetical protein